LCFHIAEFWLSSDKKFALYPPESLKVSNKNAVDWSPKTFKRFYFPQEAWDEIKVDQVLTTTPGNVYHLSVLSKVKVTKVSFSLVSFQSALKLVKTTLGRLRSNTLSNSDPDKVSGVGARQINQQLSIIKKTNSKMVVPDKLNCEGECCSIV
jgi:hypothetical protein